MRGIQLKNPEEIKGKDSKLRVVDNFKWCVCAARPVLLSNSRKQSVLCPALVFEHSSVFVFFEGLRVKD